MTLFSVWLCMSSSKNLFVKIVHPGGHVELHDRPILAAELLNRNPKCCVAHPTVFQQPYDIISPDTILILGRKYYIVPLGTIRKLQNKYYLQKNDYKQNDELEDYQTDSSCWFARRKKNRKKGKNRWQMSSQSSSESSNDSRTKIVKTKKRTKKDSGKGGTEGASPARLSLTSMDYWQPALESVTEENEQRASSS